MGNDRRYNKNNANHFYNQTFDTAKFKPEKQLKGGKYGRAPRRTYYSDGSDLLANVKKQFVSFLHVPSANSVFFKAFITSFNETYTSNWKSETVFGRTDPIHSFVQTGRTINLSLMVPAASESEAFENLDMSEEEGEKMAAKWEKKMKPCEEKGDADAEFRKEMEKCMTERMMETEGSE